MQWSTTPPTSERKGITKRNEISGAAEEGGSAACQGSDQRRSPDALSRRLEARASRAAGTRNPATQAGLGEIILDSDRGRFQ